MSFKEMWEAVVRCMGNADMQGAIASLEAVCEVDQINLVQASKAAMSGCWAQTEIRAVHEDCRAYDRDLIPSERRDVVELQQLYLKSLNSLRKMSRGALGCVG